MEKSQMLGLFVMGLTLVVLVLELAFGRHKGVHRPQDFLLTGASFLIGRVLLGPMAALVTSGVWVLLLGERFQR